MNKEQVLLNVQKKMWEWKSENDYSGELETLKESNKEAYNNLLNIAKKESQLKEIANEELAPLFEKFKKSMINQS